MDDRLTRAVAILDSEQDDVRDSQEPGFTGSTANSKTIAYAILAVGHAVCVMLDRLEVQQVEVIGLQHIRSKE